MQAQLVMFNKVRTGLASRLGVAKSGTLFEGAQMVLNQILNAGLGIATGAIMARCLGMRGLGQYQLVMSYIAIGQLAALPGMDVAINKGLLKGDDGIFRPALVRSVAMALAASLLLAIAGAGALWIGGHRWMAYSCFALAAFVPLRGFEKYDPILGGKRRFLFSRRMNTLGSLTGLAAVALAGWLTREVAWVFGALFVSRLITLAYGMRVALPLLDPKPLDDTRARELMGLGWRQTATNMALVCINQLDKLVIGTMDPSILAVYYVGNVIPSRIKDNCKVFFSTVVAKWALLEEAENFERLRQRRLAIFGFGVAATLVICLAAPIVIPILYGPSFRNAIWICQALSLTLALNFFANFVLSADIYQRKGVFNNWHTLARQSLYVILLAAMGKAWGFKGIVGANLAVEATMGAVAYGYFLVRVRRTPAGER